MARFKLSDVRIELEAIAGEQFGNQTWTRWRDVVGIKSRIRQCTEPEWKGLCACVALHKEGKRVSKQKMLDFLKRNPNPRIFLPDYIPCSMTDERIPITSDALGKDLAEEIKLRTGHKPSERTLRQYLKKVLGLRLIPTRKYTNEEINRICAYKRTIQYAQRKRAFEMLQRKSKKGEVKIT